MESQKKTQAAQLKQWRQQWKITTRKVQESQKAYLKLFRTFSQINPQYSIKVNGVLSEYQTGLKKNQKQSNTVYGKLKKINDNIDQLRQSLKYFDQTNQSLMKVQKLSQGIFSKTQGIKNQMANSYDQLDDMQKKLTSDLYLLERRIQAFDDEQEMERQQQQVDKKIKNKENISVQNRKGQINNYIQQQETQSKTKMQIIQDKMKLKQKQVEKVDEEIRDLGKFLGWHEQDHKDFLTIWNRNQLNKTYFQIQDQLVQYFKMYTAEQIIDHMNKYMKLKKLNDKKKNLINQYKELKEQKKDEQIIKLKSNQQQKLMKLKKQEQIRRYEQQQKQMKEKVQLWKKQKEDVKNQQKRKQLEQEQRRKQLQLIKRRQQENKRKQILQNRRLQQQQKQKKQKQIKQPPKRPHSAVNKQTRDRIRQRQQQIIRQKMQKAIQKKMQQQLLAKKAERIREQKMIKYAYVNSKLQQKTTTVKQKEREKFDGKQKKQANTFGGQLLLTGVRAVPEWRQGL